MSGCAIIWDYDGTLVDSRHRNLSVNRSIIEGLAGRPWQDFEALKSIEAYDGAVARCTNWRDFYQNEFGLREEVLESAGRMWTRQQLTDVTPVQPFAGVRQALGTLGFLPQGIVSQNSRAIIAATLGPLGLAEYFHHILGYEEVAPGRQKPAPDGLLDCAQRLIPTGPGTVFYVGDHPTDAMCVAEARREIAARGGGFSVWSIAALYGGESPDAWPVAPDFRARIPEDVAAIVGQVVPGLSLGPPAPGQREMEEAS